jgi:hypothetical protein
MACFGREIEPGLLYKVRTYGSNNHELDDESQMQNVCYFSIVEFLINDSAERVVMGQEVFEDNQW